MTKLFCDRCKVEVFNNPPPSGGAERIICRITCSSRVGGELDLCPDCVEDLKLFLFGVDERMGDHERT